MGAAYVGKAKVRIGALGGDVSCILVDLTVWHGPLQAGRSGHHSTTRYALPIGQASRNVDGEIVPHRFGAVVSFDPDTGTATGTIAKSVSGFHDAIGKRLSYGKLPI